MIFASSSAVRTMTSMSTPNSALTTRSTPVATAVGERFVLPRTTLPLCRWVVTFVNPALVSATEVAHRDTIDAAEVDGAKERHEDHVAIVAWRRLRREVRPGQPGGLAASLGLLRLFLPAEGGEVEEVVGATGWTRGRGRPYGQRANPPE